MKHIYYLTNDTDYVIDMSYTDKTNEAEEIFYEYCELEDIEYYNISKSIEMSMVDDVIDENKLIYKIIDGQVLNTLMATVQEKASSLGTLETLEEYIFNKDEFDLSIPAVKAVAEVLVQLPDNLFTKLMSMVQSGMLTMYDFVPILCQNEDYEALMRSSLTEYIELNRTNDNFKELNFNVNTQRDRYKDIVYTYFREDRTMKKIFDNNPDVLDNILIFATEDYNTTTNVDKIIISSTDRMFMKDNNLSEAEFKKIKSLTHYMYNRTNLKFGVTDNIDVLNLNNAGVNCTSIVQETTNLNKWGSAYTTNKHNNFKLTYYVSSNSLADISLVETSAVDYTKSGAGSTATITHYGSNIDLDDTMLYSEMDDTTKVEVIKFGTNLELNIYKNDSIVHTTSGEVCKDGVYVVVRVKDNNIGTKSAINDLKFLNILK